MPVWNAGPFLAPAVASLLAQTETDFELLAVDDGSTDDSRETLHQLAAADRRVRLIEHGQGNEGIATARKPPAERPPGKAGARSLPSSTTTISPVPSGCVAR